MSQVQTQHGQPGIFRQNAITLNDNDGAALPLDSTGRLISTATVTFGSNTPSTGAGAADAGTLRVVDANNDGKTLQSSGGSVAGNGNNTLVAAGVNKLKVYAFSLTTTSTTAVTCIFQSGAGGTELWRVILQAPTGASTGANLSVAVPAFLFATANATLLNLNLSSAQTIHWAASWYDEA